MSSTKDAQKRVVGKPFVSGDARANPGGRFRMTEPEIAMLDCLSPKALKALGDGLEAMRPVVVGNGPHATVEMVPDHAVRIASADKILCRKYGKPAQEITGAEGTPLFGAIAADLLDSMKKLVGE